MAKILSCLVFCFFTLTPAFTHAQGWTPVGSPGFTPTAAGFPSLAIDTGGALYVAYTNGFMEGPVNLMKYDGSSWAAVGSPDFSAGAAQSTSLALDTGGSPYVVYVDEANGYAASAMKFDGSSWVSVGSPGFSAGEAGGTVMAIDKNGTPYVAYLDWAYSKKATVMKFNGSSWVNVGIPGFSDTAVTDIAIAIDNSGTPYIAYNDYYLPRRSTVMKYNGSAWVTVGSPRFSDSTAIGMSIAIDTGGTPYVVYADFGADDGFTGAASVRKFNGSSWVFVGSPGFATYNSYYATIAINKYGTPYVAFESSTGSASAMKYNGSSWIPVGSLDFSAGGIGWTDIVINKSGTPYVSYSDYIYSNNATVMEFTTPISPITGIDTLCIGATTTLSDVTAGGTWGSTNTTIAVVSASGIVTGMAPGTATIYYSVAGNSVTAIVVVDSLPFAGSITGLATLCADSAITMADTVTGGAWSSSDTTIAIVGSTGIVSGITTGTATISYSVTNGYCSSVASEIVTIDLCPTSIKNSTPTYTSLTIFPSPNQGTFTLHLSTPQSEPATIIITNLLGQKVKEPTTTSNTDTQIQLDAPPGIYFISATTKNETVTQKVILE